MSNITEVLAKIADGDAQSRHDLLPLVYDQLRTLARAKLNRERPGHTLQATALVHEAYMRVFKPGATNDWDSRAQFFTAAAQAMRWILIENIRRKRSLKRGGEFCRIEFDPLQVTSPERDDKLLALDSALDQLEEMDPQKAELVKLRFFVGLNKGEVAEVLGISPSTVDRKWAFARAWLQSEMKEA